ncbi:sensor histidine kinase [Actinoplanes flavus]|uniref:histidine kinase n=1 Tax=Actinoplanes flavus TaxID=2820290 RepID=A0ABS3UCT8_9ACTN|nr:HAMP domain-containing sensor histidine kinase [Actinoplanes flavus]MBO3736590.1 HAMP domain-containing histidine kinase [Actinoplanes flavus]
MTRRILFTYLSVAVAVLLALGIPLGTVYAHHERDGFAADVERDAVVLAEQAEADIATGDTAHLAEHTTAFGMAGDARVLIVGLDRSVLAATGTGLTGDDAAISTALTGRHAIGYRPLPGNDTELYVAVPARIGADVLGAVLIAYPSTAVDAAATRFWLTLAVGSALILLLVTVAGLALTRWITRPVRRLEDAAEVIGHGGELPTAGIGPPELRRLAVRLSETSRRLHRLITGQRDFTSTVSHQLRSPLTALRLRLENLEPAVADTARPDLDAAITEVDRLTRMVHGLLALAHLEHQAADREPVDLDTLIDERIDNWSAYASEQDVALVRSPGALGTAWAVPEAIEQIVDNLLANALRVTPPQTVITVGATVPPEDGATVELHVVDQGPGLSDEDRARAFDRFWRVAGSADDGSGLGLTIVRQLARISGGEAELRAAPAGGIDATVRLRRAPHPRPPTP